MPKDVSLSRQKQPLLLRIGTLKWNGWKFSCIHHFPYLSDKIRLGSAATSSWRNDFRGHKINGEKQDTSSRRLSEPVFMAGGPESKSENWNAHFKTSSLLPTCYAPSHSQWSPLKAAIEGERTYCTSCRDLRGEQRQIDIVLYVLWKLSAALLWSG